MSKESELIDQIIAHGFLAQQVYSKVQFDNAKDATELLTLAQSNAEIAQAAIKHKLAPYIDHLLEQRLRKFIDESNGEIVLTLGNGEFTLVKAEVKS